MHSKFPYGSTQVYNPPPLSHSIATTVFAVSLLKLLYLVTAGLFCPHMVKLLCHLHVDKIPAKYILKRYTRNAKEGSDFDGHDYRHFGLDSTTEIFRRNMLLNEATTIARAAAKSGQRYDTAMKDLRDLHRKTEAIPCEDIQAEQHNDHEEMDNRPPQVPFIKAPISATKGRKPNVTKQPEKKTIKRS